MSVPSTSSLPIFRIFAVVVFVSPGFGTPQRRGLGPSECTRWIPRRLSHGELHVSSFVGFPKEVLCGRGFFLVFPFLIGFKGKPKGPPPFLEIPCPDCREADHRQPGIFRKRVSTRLLSRLEVLNSTELLILPKGILMVMDRCLMSFSIYPLLGPQLPK